MIATIATPDAPQAIGPYSQAVVADGFVFALGQIALDPKTGEMVGDTVEAQTEQIFSNVQALLQAAGSDLEHVIKTTCFLASIEEFAAFNEVYGRYFKTHLPARSALGVAGLPKGALVEVEVIAKETDA